MDEAEERWLRWWEWSAAPDAFGGMRVERPRSGGVADQDAKDWAALAVLRAVYAAMRAEAARKPERQARRKRGSRDER